MDMREPFGFASRSGFVPGLMRKECWIERECHDLGVGRKTARPTRTNLSFITAMDKPCGPVSTTHRRPRTSCHVFASIRQ